MCDECRKMNCDPRCPNADDSGIYCYCNRKKCKIYCGDYHWTDFFDETLCEECVNDMSSTDILEYFKFTLNGEYWEEPGGIILCEEDVNDMIADDILERLSFERVRAEP